MAGAEEGRTWECYYRDVCSTGVGSNLADRSARHEAKRSGITHSREKIATKSGEKESRERARARTRARAHGPKTTFDCTTGVRTGRT